MSKREIILKTAARLFAAQGFEATTTIQIAREAGATEPLIYYHFKSKKRSIRQIRIKPQEKLILIKISKLSKT